jgi:hypothetical protein
MRFNTKSALILVALLALWLSTFSGGYFAYDIRRVFHLAFVVLLLVASIYNRGRNRAFWASFTAIWLVVGFHWPFDRPTQFSPRFLSFEELAYSVARSLSVNGEAMAESFRVLFVAVVASVVGYLAMRIYDSAAKG